MPGADPSRLVWDVAAVWHHAPTPDTLTCEAAACGHHAPATIRMVLLKRHPGWTLTYTKLQLSEGGAWTCLVCERRVKLT